MSLPDTENTHKEGRGGRSCQVREVTFSQKHQFKMCQCSLQSRSHKPVSKYSIKFRMDCSKLGSGMYCGLEAKQLYHRFQLPWDYNKNLPVLPLEENPSLFLYFIFVS